ncbi:MAG: response regulator [Thermoflexibacter sp.]|jgi:DNA-binding NtrC family response regulator|nr:response regulator [Thermoflexibacter sp.]
MTDIQDSPYKLFVIEDNRTEGMLLQLALAEIENLEIKTFPNGKSMLERLHENPVIVIVDLILPDMSGLDLIKHIKKYNDNIRIVVVSAQRSIDVIADLQAEGIFNYLIKSEACLNYLHNVIEDLLIIIQHKTQVLQ